MFGFEQRRKSSRVFTTTFADLSASCLSSDLKILWSARSRSRRRRLTHAPAPGYLRRHLLIVLLVIYHLIWILWAGDGDGHVLLRHVSFTTTFADRSTCCLSSDLKIMWSARSRRRRRTRAPAPGFYDDICWLFHVLFIFWFENSVICQELEQKTETDTCSCAGLFTTAFASRSTCYLFSDLKILWSVRSRSRRQRRTRAPAPRYVRRHLLIILLVFYLMIWRFCGLSGAGAGDGDGGVLLRQATYLWWHLPIAPRVDYFLIWRFCGLSEAGAGDAPGYLRRHLLIIPRVIYHLLWILWCVRSRSRRRRRTRAPAPVYLRRHLLIVPRVVYFLIWKFCDLPGAGDRDGHVLLRRAIYDDICKSFCSLFIFWFWIKWSIRSRSRRRRRTCAPAPVYLRRHLLIVLLVVYFLIWKFYGLSGAGAGDRDEHMLLRQAVYDEHLLIVPLVVYLLIWNSMVCHEQEQETETDTLLRRAIYDDICWLFHVLFIFWFENFVVWREQETEADTCSCITCHLRWHLLIVLLVINYLIWKFCCLPGAGAGDRHMLLRHV